MWYNTWESNKFLCSNICGFKYTISGIIHISAVGKEIVSKVVVVFYKTFPSKVYKKDWLIPVCFMTVNETKNQGVPYTLFRGMSQKLLRSQCTFMIWELQDILRITSKQLLLLQLREWEWYSTVSSAFWESMKRLSLFLSGSEHENYWWTVEGKEHVTKHRLIRKGGLNMENKNYNQIHC